MPRAPTSRCSRCSRRRTPRRPPSTSASPRRSTSRARRRRHAGDAAGAVNDFLRVGKLAPGAAIRETAEFDAGAMLVCAQGLAARDSRARGLPRKLSHEPAPGRRDPKPRARLSRGRPARRGRRRIRAHRGIRAPRRRTCSAMRLWQAAELYEKSSQPARAMADLRILCAALPGAARSKPSRRA